MSTVTEKFIWIIAQLHGAIGAFVARQARARSVVWLGTQAHVPLRAPNALPPLPDEAWGLLWHRLARLANRFRALFDQWRHARLPRPRPRPAPRPATSTERPRAPHLPCAARLPRAIGWVNRRIPESAPPTGQLAALLEDPETRAFVQAAPQAGRLLRPLCRALGVPLPDWLGLPRRPRPVRAPPPPAAITIPPAERPRTPDRPLPPYVRTAARAWKRKFG